MTCVQWEKGVFEKDCMTNRDVVFSQFPVDEWLCPLFYSEVIVAVIEDNINTGFFNKYWP